MNNQKPLLSICIGSYNRAELLRENLNHLAETLDPSYEITVSANFSPDHTIEVLEEFAKKWDNLRYVRQPVFLTMEENFTAAALMTTGKYTYPLCDDDRIEFDGISRAVEILEQKQDVGAVYGSYAEWKPKENQILKSIFTKEDNYFPKGSQKEIAKKHHTLWSPVVRTEIYNRFAVKSQIRNHLAYRQIVTHILNYSGVMVIPDILYRHRQTEVRSEHKLTEGWLHDLHRADYEIFLGQMETGSYEISKQVCKHCAPVYRQGVRFSIENKQWLAGRDWILRARAYGEANDHELGVWEKTYCLHMAVERICELVKIAPGIKKIILETHTVTNKVIDLLKENITNHEISQLSQQELLDLKIEPEYFIIPWDYETLREINKKPEINRLRQCAMKDIILNNLVLHKNISFD